MSKIRVTIWNEFRHEKSNEGVRKIYPEGMHKTIGKGIACDEFEIRYATLDEPEHGLSDDVLNQTDVLLWWGHCAHAEVKDEIVAKVQQRVWDGMGLICLHSAHMSKIFRLLNGTSGKLHWREVGEKERLWCVNPAHPIAVGIPETFELEHEEMYGEPFCIAWDAQPVFISWFEGGEVFRSGVTFQRGNGKVFYFRPGHEAYRTFYNPMVMRVISNGVRWAAPTLLAPFPKTHRPDSYEPISDKGEEFPKAGIILE